MKLRDWLDERDMTNADFAEKIGRTAEAVRRYAAGERVPDRETMPLIVANTSGMVLPNDFFDVGGELTGASAAA